MWSCHNTTTSWGGSLTHQHQHKSQHYGSHYPHRINQRPFWQQVQQHCSMHHGQPNHCHCIHFHAQSVCVFKIHLQESRWLPWSQGSITVVPILSHIASDANVQFQTAVWTWTRPTWTPDWGSGSGFCLDQTVSSIHSLALPWTHVNRFEPLNWYFFNRNKCIKFLGMKCRFRM